jgi:NADH-quinone oxidoreductase subunit K
MAPLAHYLIFGALLFSIGMVGLMTRRNLILLLASIELMLVAANVNLVAFWRYHPQPLHHLGDTFALFVLTIAAAEAAVGLALVIAMYRHYRSTSVDAVRQIKS